MAIKLSFKSVVIWIASKYDLGHIEAYVASLW